MTNGAGRFATGYEFDIVKRFFERSGGSSGDYSNDFPPGIYTKADIAARFGITNAGLSLQQYNFNDNQDNYVERVYVWNSGQYQIADSAIFVVGDDGARQIEEFYVAPRPRSTLPTTDDFAFEGNWLASAVGDLYLEPRIDPSGIGRTVNIEFVGERATSIYTEANYLADQAAHEANFVSTAGAISALFEGRGLVAGLFEAGATRFLTAADMPILYGSERPDNLTWATIRDSAPYLSQYLANGVVILGGQSSDNIQGSQYDDILSGNALGTVTDIEDFAKDTLQGGLGRDIYYLGDADVSYDAGGRGFGWFWDYDKDSAGNIRYDEYNLLLGRTSAKIDDWDGAFTVNTFVSASAPLRAASIDGVAAEAETAGLADLVRAGSASVTVDERGGASVQVNGQEVLSFVGFNWSDGGLSLDTGREDISLRGATGDDHIIGTSRANLIVGGSGNDTLDGKSGADEISGENGDDRIIGGSGDDRLFGDRGADTIRGDSGDDFLSGGMDADLLDGGSGDDVVVGGRADDRLYGGSGDDRILGGEGNDRMTGDSGRDVFVFHAGDGADVVTDYRWFGRGSHHDAIEISAEIVGFDSFGDIQAAATQVGSSTVINFGNDDTLTLEHVRMSSLQAGDFVFI